MTTRTFFSLFQVIEIKDSVPAESYRIFMDILLDTIRNEIGNSKFDRNFSWIPILRSEASSEDVLADSKPLTLFFRKTIKARAFQR
jgi:hypothetical protein